MKKDILPGQGEGGEAGEAIEGHRGDGLSLGFLVGARGEGGFIRILRKITGTGSQGEERK